MFTDRLLEFCCTRWEADAALRIEDAYKWLFQAIQGGEHALSDIAAVQARLVREWDGLSLPFPDEQLLEPLRPDGAIVRVNLRPYRAAGGDPDALFAAFRNGVAAWRSDPALLRAAWAQLGVRLRTLPCGALTHTEWAVLDATLAQQGYPAIHHSAHYAALRIPAYRIMPAHAATLLAGSPT